VRGRKEEAREEELKEGSLRESEREVEQENHLAFYYEYIRI
jgi:hypothetical protein